MSSFSSVDNKARALGLGRPYNPVGNLNFSLSNTHSMTTSTFPISLPRSKPTIFSFAPMKKCWKHGLRTRHVAKVSANRCNVYIRVLKQRRF